MFGSGQVFLSLWLFRTVRSGTRVMLMIYYAQSSTCHSFMQQKPPASVFPQIALVALRGGSLFSSYFSFSFNSSSSEQQPLNRNVVLFICCFYSSFSSTCCTEMLKQHKLFLKGSSSLSENQICPPSCPRWAVNQTQSS